MLLASLKRSAQLVQSRCSGLAGLCSTIDAVFRTIQQSYQHTKFFSVRCSYFITFYCAYITTIRSSDNRTQLVSINVSVCASNR
eukprot:scaffold6742_cov158-Skeletonema_menzelii.AAC.1